MKNLGLRLKHSIHITKIMSIAGVPSNASIDFSHISSIHDFTAPFKPTASLVTRLFTSVTDKQHSETLVSRCVAHIKYNCLFNISVFQIYDLDVHSVT